MTQQSGIDSLFSGGNDYSDKKDRRTTIIFIKSNGRKTFAARSSTSTLVQHVQQNACIYDPQQVTKYAQQALEMINEHINNNPQGLHSLFSNFMED